MGATSTTSPLLVGAAAIPSLAGWAWVLCAEGTQHQGVFDGPITHLADHLRDQIATFSEGRQVAPVHLDFPAIGTPQVREREFRARMEAGREAVKETAQIARQARERLRLEHPFRPPLHSARTSSPPFSLDPNRFGQIACDASVDAERGHGAWAVTSEAGWYQCGIIQADPGSLHVITAELIALHRAATFARTAPGETQVFNDNAQAVQAAHLLQKGGSKQKVHLRWPVIPQSPVDGLHSAFRNGRFNGPLNIVWWPRNITPAMKWADYLAGQTRTGKISATESTLDLRGKHPPHHEELPRLVTEFIEQATSSGWNLTSVELSRHLPFSRSVKVERAGVQLTGTWQRRGKTWIPNQVHREENGKSQTFRWTHHHVVLE